MHHELRLPGSREQGIVAGQGPFRGLARGRQAASRAKIIIRHFRLDTALVSLEPLQQRPRDEDDGDDLQPAHPHVHDENDLGQRVDRRSQDA